MNRETIYVINYALASSDYQQKNKAYFAHNLRLADEAELICVLISLQLAGNFYQCLQLNQLRLQNYQLVLEGVMDIQEIFNGVLRDEIIALSDGIDEESEKVILLKGPGMWNDMNYKFRTVADVDILIRSKPEIYSFIALLNKAGYRCEADVDREIEEDIHYELSTFRKKITIQNPSPGKVHLFQFIQHTFKEYSKILFTETTIEVLCDIEIHKALYLDPAVKFPVVSDTDIVLHHYFEKVYKLNSIKNICYLAYKYCRDYEEYLRGALVKRKCMKILAEFVNSFDNLNNDDIPAVIHTAKNMNSNTDIKACINTAFSLMSRSRFENVGVNTHNHEDLIYKFLA